MLLDETFPQTAAETHWLFRQMFNIVFWGPVVRLFTSTTSACRLQQQQQQQPYIPGIPAQYLEVEIITHSTALQEVMWTPVWMDVLAMSSISPTAGTKQQLSQSVLPAEITSQTYSGRLPPPKSKGPYFPLFWRKS